MIHFDLDDRYQDELVVGSAITSRERVLLSIIIHLLLVIGVLVAPKMAIFQPSPEELEARQQEMLRRQQEEEQARRFVFVQPRVDMPALRVPDRAELSDLDRRAQAPVRAPTPVNPLPFSRGDSAERTEASEAERARGAETATPPDIEPPRPEPEETLARALPQDESGIRRVPDLSRPAPGALGEALRNLQQYVQNETFHNPQGGTNDPGATIQFDTKGIEFGPWLRRFVAQVRRNWFIPQAAMNFSGRVVVRFNIHKNGRITDIVVIGPSSIDAFNRAAFNAILGSNPVEPLPPEYPDPVAAFTVTFFYNEDPSRP